MIDKNNNRIKNMHVVHSFYNKNMTHQYDEIDFMEFFKGAEKVLSHMTSTPFKHFFKGTIESNSQEMNYIFKVIPYIKSRNQTTGIFDQERPENSEVIIHNLLFNFVKSKSLFSIMIPYVSFITDIRPFVDKNIKQIIGEDNEKYMVFIDKYYENKIHDKVKILITEYGENFKVYLIKNKHNFTFLIWQLFLFQIILALSIIQETYPSFKHNSLGINNIYVIENNDINIVEKIKYIKLDNKELFFENSKYNYAISNFSLSTIDNLIHNTRTENNIIKKLYISNKQNRYYDLHFFLSDIFHICLLHSIDLPFEITEFIYRIIPHKYRLNDSKYNRINIDEEITTPKEVILNDPLFFNFRKKLNIDTSNNTIIEI